MTANASLLLAPLREDEVHALAKTLAAMSPWRERGYGVEGLSRYLSAPDPALTRHVILMEKEPVGILCMRHPWLRGPYLELFAVLDGHRGKGVGSWAMGIFLDEAVGKGKNAWACVSEENEGARRFYARFGFTEVGPLPGLVSEGRCELFLRKRL